MTQPGCQLFSSQRMHYIINRVKVYKGAVVELKVNNAISLSVNINSIKFISGVAPKKIFKMLLVIVIGIAGVIASMGSSMSVPLTK